MRDTQKKNLRADPLSRNGGMVARLYLGFLTWDAFPFSAHMYAAVWGIATPATCEAWEVLLSSSTHAAPRCRSRTLVAMPRWRRSPKADVAERDQGYPLSAKS